MDETARLQSLLREKDEEIERLKSLLHNTQLKEMNNGVSAAAGPVKSSDLTKAQIERYSRQIILPEIGVEGQKRLMESSVLIVGAGGLGCPAAIYLAAAGIGHLGIVDYDKVEASNLHRQVLHKESEIGSSKAESVRRAVHALNSSVKVTDHCVQIDNSNALEIVSSYDLVLDCSDNPATRYLINDACVIAKKPLISGSALRWEGQLTIYNDGKNGPCYRCLYPTPPDPKFVTNCSDGGVIGVVPGVMGTLQAMEAIKHLVGLGSSYSQRLLIFDGESGLFRVVKLRPKQADCAVCGDSRTITDLTSFDYSVFCGRGPTDKELGLRILSAEDRVTVHEFHRMTSLKRSPYLLIDVRPPLEMAICSLPDSLNVPFETLDDPSTLNDVRSWVVEKRQADLEPGTEVPLSVLVVCRRGNNSQLAVGKLKEALKDLPVVVKDIVGGLKGWAEQVDSQFPIY